jgi:8-oxo-dGTP pyrophosphatase MutT (NUDIX family)
MTDSPQVFTAESLRQRLHATAPDCAYVIGDAGAPLKMDKVTTAAVLIPIVLHQSGLTVVFTRRTDHLQDHGGQISFPGGRSEPEDATLVETALREALEETGLQPLQVEVIGTLPEYHTVTGYCVTPVLGLIAPPVVWSPDPFEVAEVFEVPLAFLMDTQNHQRHSGEWKGEKRDYYAIPYNEYNIWGATAGMLISMQRRLGINL